MKATLLVTTYHREQHLRWSLETLLSQDLKGLKYDILVLNDGTEDGTEALVKEFSRKGLIISYLFTGQRNRNGNGRWRVPGFAFNIGIKHSDSEIVVLTCSDIYHLGNTLRPIVDAVKTDPWALATVREVYDDWGSLYNYMETTDAWIADEVNLIVDGIKSVPPWIRDTAPRPCPEMPFFLAMRRKRIIDIGGYDEDFTGYACEDNDLMERLVTGGCHYVKTGAEVVHLYHGMRTHKKVQSMPGYRRNLDLWTARRGQIVRNVGRPWGVL